MNAIWHLRCGYVADRLRSKASRQAAAEKLFRGFIRKIDVAPLHTSGHQQVFLMMRLRIRCISYCYRAIFVPDTFVR
jgi:hypothetical protein